MKTDLGITHLVVRIKLGCLCVCLISYSLDYQWFSITGSVGCFPLTLSIGKIDPCWRWVTKCKTAIFRLYQHFFVSPWFWLCWLFHHKVSPSAHSWRQLKLLPVMWITSRASPYLGRAPLPPRATGHRWGSPTPPCSGPTTPGRWRMLRHAWGCGKGWAVCQSVGPWFSPSSAPSTCPSKCVQRGVLCRLYREGLVS